MLGSFPQSGFGVLVFGAAAEEFPFPLGHRESCSRLAKTNRFLELSSLDGRNRGNSLRQIPKLAAPPSPSSYTPPSFDPRILQQHWCRFPGFSLCPTPQFAGLSGRLVSHPFIPRNQEKQRLRCSQSPSFELSESEGSTPKIPNLLVQLQAMDLAGTEPRHMEVAQEQDIVLSWGQHVSLWKISGKGIMDLLIIDII